jgi:hypothetical protein
MFVRNAVGDYRLKKANMVASMDAVTFLSADIPTKNHGDGSAGFFCKIYPWRYRENRPRCTPVVFVVFVVFNVSV